MRFKSLAITSAAALAAFALPSTAFAQMMADGSEIAGHNVQVVMSDGSTNTIAFQPGGTATITTAQGMSMPANWSATGGNLCLQTATARECVPYRAAFQPQQTLSLTSDCGSTASWTALSTNQPAPPSTRRAGERG